MNRVDGVLGELIARNGEAGETLAGGARSRRVEARHAAAPGPEPDGAVWGGQHATHDVFGQAVGGGEGGEGAPVEPGHAAGRFLEGVAGLYDRKIREQVHGRW